MTEPGPHSTIRFILGSASPARLRTLLSAGVVPEVIVSHVDESAAEGHPPAELVQVLANAKARAIADRLRSEAIARGEELPAGALVLGCDSMLEFDGAALGKPASNDEAVERWKRMRGRTAILHTGHCLIDVGAGRLAISTVSTSVHFGDITDDEIEVYCSSGEPANVAGAFTIDGLGGWFIDAIDGDHHNVVGVSLPALRKLLLELNVTLRDIGYPTP